MAIDSRKKLKEFSTMTGKVKITDESVIYMGIIIFALQNVKILSLISTLFNNPNKLITSLIIQPQNTKNTYYNIIIPWYSNQLSARVIKSKWLRC